MKIILIILQSIDGYLARDNNDDLSWGSKQDKEFFRTKTKEIGTMIMGSGTFEKMPDLAFKDRLSIVMTSSSDKYNERIELLRKQGNDIELNSSTPELCIDYLITKGIEEAALIGGGKLDGAFLKSGLIDEMYISIAPVVFGNGIKAFDTGDSEALLQEYYLADVDRFGEREVLLHYKRR